MADQTHCFICTKHLHGGGVYCYECEKYMHVKCSGLARSKDHVPGFVCINCHNKTAKANPSTPLIDQLTPMPEDIWQHLNHQHYPSIERIYLKIVHWKPVFFILPKNKNGYKFVDILNTLLATTFPTNPEKSKHALKLAMILPHLTLARTKAPKDNSVNDTLGRRLDMFIRCEYDELFDEASALQQRLNKTSRTKPFNEFKEFDNHMSKGKISNAIRCLTEELKGGPLSTTQIVEGQSVMNILEQKHPNPKPADDSYLERNCYEETLPYHPTIFDKIDSSAIKRSAMKTNGSHGPSGLNADEWRRLLTVFKNSSLEICKTIASLARKIATTEIDQSFLAPYNACRLIALDKNPGVRPIGVGEVLRRIIGRSITACLKSDLTALGGNRQLCLGQKCGIEHAIHSLRESFETDSNNAILLIDAKNAFNSLNRDLALKNIKTICPSLYTSLHNSYSTPSNLFIDGKTILSKEGTTQGDPLAMAMYGTAILPLMKKVAQPNTCQKWYADDGNAVGDLATLRRLYDDLKIHGPGYGYHLTKCHLIVRKNKIETAQEIFAGQNIDLLDGHRVLGSIIGSDTACASFMVDKANENVKLIKKLADHSKVSPQSVYKAYTQGVQHKITFITRTTPDSHILLHETEKVISDELLPKMLGKNDFDQNLRKVFSLPIKDGGLNILMPDDRTHEYAHSKRMTEPFLENDAIAISTGQIAIAESIRKEKRNLLKLKRDHLIDDLDVNQKYSLELASEKGSSSWIHALPLQRYNFELSKSEFRDGIALRYGWDPKKIPSYCTCGEKFTVAHAMHCPKGGYTHIRHNEIRDEMAKLMDEVCYDVSIEPNLQPLQSERFDNKSTTREDEARLDIKANGLWESRFTRTFFDVKVFNPHAKSCPKNIADAYKYHEAIKKSKYEERVIKVEKSTFCPLIFSCTGGAGPSATKAMKRLACLISDKRNEPYADVVSYIRTKLSFALLRSSILCIRGCRSLKSKRIQEIESTPSVIVEEGKLSANN